MDKNFELKSYLKRAVVLLLAMLIVLTYMPVNAFAAAETNFSKGTKATVSYGGKVEDANGKVYSIKGGSFVARFSTKSGKGFAYRVADGDTSAKRTYVVKKSGKPAYVAYCIEHGAWLEDANTTYTADDITMDNVQFMQPYTDEERQAMMLALLYGRQPNMKESDVPVDGCNLDDWYMATQMIIWEIQQGLRTSKSGAVNYAIKGTHSVTYSTKAYGGTVTRTQPGNFFFQNIDGRPAEKMYNWMLAQMKLHYETPKKMYRSEKELKKGDVIKLKDNGDGTYSAKVDGNKCNQDIKLLEKNTGISITRSGKIYTITSDHAITSETSYEAKRVVKAIEPRDDLIVWTSGQPASVGDSNHLQSVTTGASDPIQVFFKLVTTDVPAEGGGEPKLPSFSLDVEKLDENAGFDGDQHTGMGDAALDATIDLVVGGEVVESKILDANGHTDGPFEFMPWSDISELTKRAVPKYDDKGNLLYTDYYWEGTKTVKTVESAVPNGRFTEEESGTGTGERDHGTIVYYAHRKDDGPIDYNITYENGALTNEADISEDNPQKMIYDTGDQAYVDDNFRGKLQIIKTKTDLDPFTNSSSGITGSEGSTTPSGSTNSYSTNSKWTIQLVSGGYEGNPYIHVAPLNKGEEGYSAYANNYKVVRDTSGTAADETNPLTVSKYGQINIVDLPYGYYLVKEISADSNGYVLESHYISITEDEQLISTDTNNVPKKNKVQILKVNSETGKTVRLDENAAFRIKYLGNPDSAVPVTEQANYGKYLPNGSSYTDGAAASKNDYTFYCDENGQIVLPYELEYGNYQLEEITVPYGYYVGQYDEKGNGTSIDMDKTFLESVKIYDENGKKVTDFTNNDKIIYNKYKFSVTDQTAHTDGEEYVTYYLTVKMKNNPVKGKIEITKNGEALGGWLNENQRGYDLYSAVWDKNLLKDAKFNIYAADDIRQVDAVQKIKAYASKTDKEVELDEVTRDHSQVTGAKAFFKKLLDTGEKILRWIGLDVGGNNECETEYTANADKGASYSTSFTRSENGLTYKYTVNYGMTYTKGGMSYTDIHVAKDILADDYVASIDAPKPKLTSGGEEVDINDVNLLNKNIVKLNGEIVDEYGKDDVTAKKVAKTFAVSPADMTPQAPEGYTIDDTNTKVILAVKETRTPGENEGDPEVVTKEYKVYINENGSLKWADADENGIFTDNAPVPTEGYTLLHRSDVYMAENAGTYQIYVTDGGEKKWITCDNEGNFYKSYHQEYNFTTVQHFNTADGFEFSFDGFKLVTKADDEKQTVSTVITNMEGATAPTITTAEGWTSENEGNVTTITGEPKTAAPVYFKTNDGIITSMIYSGGLTATSIKVTQSQLYRFGADSNPEDTTSQELIYPAISYNGDVLEWCKDLGPENSRFEKIIDENNFVKVERVEVTPANKEVYYDITIVSNNKDEGKGFEVTYPDTTKTSMLITTDEGKDVGKLIFTSIEGTMVYPIGSPVTTITTDENGIATSPELPLGTYYVQEVSSSTGHVNAGSWQKFTISYKDQYTPLIWDGGTFENDAVNVKIDLTKLFETAYGSKKYDSNGSGAVFGVYSAEAINATTKTDKKISKKTIDADTLVGVMTVTDGKASLTAKLPLGKYYVKEITAPEGYKVNATKYYFDATDVLTSDQLSFSYKDAGVSGQVTQDGNHGVVIDLETLYRNPAANMIIDKATYDMSKDAANGNVTNTVLDGRTKTKITLKDGESTSIKLDNDSTLTVTAKGNTYTASFDGSLPTFSDITGNGNISKVTEGSKTTFTYSPKVTTANFLSEVTFSYNEPKEDATEAEKAKKTSLTLTAPVNSDSIKADVNYIYSEAVITITGEVNGITVDDKAIDVSNSLTLKRITKEGEGPDAKEVIKATRAVINFADGTSFTAEFDLAGNFYMTTSGNLEGDLTSESTLSVDGRTDIENIEGVNLKNTTAKTYARSNTNAGVLNITINSVKNDRLPSTPVTPIGPSIHTTALDSSTKDHVSSADGSVRIIDTVTYQNLTVGKTYVMQGTLMDKATGNPILDKDGEITAEKTFTPEKSSGSVEMTFTFDGSNLAGKTTVVFEKVYEMVDTDKDGKPDTPADKETAKHEDLKDDGQTIYFPEIKTNATDSATGDHIANADKKVTITDEVSYTNLIPGKEYTVKGTLMDKSTGKALLVDGKKVTAVKTFTPEKANGSVTLIFELNASSLAGKTTVVFEKIYLGNKVVGVHEDLTEKNQTVCFPDVKTSASSTKDGVITDIVKYTNLIPGKEYTVSGVLMDKASGKPVLDKEGKEITAEKTFTPSKSSGTVKLNFCFDKEDVAGKTTVVFETLTLNGEIVGTHKDINDKDQTVRFGKEGAPNSKDDSKEPATGDTNALGVYLLLLLLSASSIGLGVKQQKRKNEE